MSTKEDIRGWSRAALGVPAAVVITLLLAPQIGLAAAALAAAVFVGGAVAVLGTERSHVLIEARRTLVWRSLLGVPRRKRNLGTQPSVTQGGWDWDEISLVSKQAVAAGRSSHDGERFVFAEWNLPPEPGQPIDPVADELVTVLRREIARLQPVALEDAPAVTISPAVLEEIRRHGLTRVEAPGLQLDVLLLYGGLGPAFYLTEQGRVLRDGRGWDGTAVRPVVDPDEVATAIVLGAKKTGIARLNELIPRLSEAVVCPLCTGSRFAALGPLPELVCPACHGRGEVDVGLLEAFETGGGWSIASDQERSAVRSAMRALRK